MHQRSCSSQVLCEQLVAAGLPFRKRTLMPRARLDDVPAAATDANNDRGCLPIFLLPPMIVLLFGAGMIGWAPPTSFTIPQNPRTNEGSSLISPLFTPQVQYWSDSIKRWAAASGLDPNLVALVIQIESCGDPTARSQAGAMGLFQVMPYHFLPTDDPFTPDTNAARGLAYLKRSLAAASNDLRLALAGYNGGISVISQPESIWPAETKRYAYWGTGIYQDIQNGSATSARLNEWLAAGGSSMCSRAGQKLQS